MLKKLAIICVAIAALQAAPLQAAPASAVHVAVPYGDLNLASAQGRMALHRRLEVAAGMVCGGEPDMKMPGYRAYRRCVFDALQRAIDKVPAGRPQMAAAQDLTVQARR
ncbi:MAG: UrcA family protein [Alphaproteobacteria bacterium]|nr:UrcA family protein [Alphaproteobacteria bacterium]